METEARDVFGLTVVEGNKARLTLEIFDTQISTSDVDGLLAGIEQKLRDAAGGAIRALKDE